MANLNKIQLIGSLGADAEIRQVGQNTVANFRMATSDRRRQADGTYTEETTWHSVSLWGNQGVQQYLVKGASVYVEGSYKCKEWQDQQGNKRKDYYVNAFVLQLLGSKPQNQQAAPQYQQPAPPVYAPQQPYQPAAPQYQAPPMPPQAPGQPMPPYPGQPGNNAYPPMNSPAYTVLQDDDMPAGF